MRPFVYQQSDDVSYEPDRGKWFWYDETCKNWRNPKYLGQGDVGPFDTEQEAQQNMEEHYGQHTA